MLRSIAVGGALVGSLAMASSASAALAGGASAHFVNRPNLESVTFNGLVATFRFDKPVQQIVANPTFRRSFTVGGYRASNGVVGGAAVDTANISISDPRNVLVTYTDNEVDFNASTFGAVAAGIVRGFGTFATENLADATALTGSASESGTRGHTAGPDLQSVVLDPDNNEIDFVMDQDVDDNGANNPDPRNFNFYSADGVDHVGDNVVDVNGNVVTVAYTNDDIKSAQVAYVRGQIIGTGNLPQSDDDSGNPTPAPVAVSVDVPGKAGATVRPKLVSAELEPNSSTIVYTFDQNVAGGTASDFFANASNGGRREGTSLTIIGKQVRVTFGGIDNFTEHLVSASVFSGTVTGTNGQFNMRGGKPIGGNAGAKASGWTTAPDAISATMNPASGQVTVLFDSRLTGAINASNFQLLGDNGVVIGTPNGAPTVSQNIGGPSQARVILQYEPTTVAIAAALRINGGLNTGGAFSNPAGNVAVLGTAPTLGAGVTADSRPILVNIVPTATSSNFSASK